MCAEAEKDALKLPLEGYRALVGLIQHEEGLFWRRVEVLFVFNAALVAIIGLIRPEDASQATETQKVLSLMISILGILIAILWLIIVRRSEAFYNYWYEQLEYIEKQYLAPLEIFQVADDYFRTGKATIGRSTANQKEIRLDFISRQLKIYHAVIAVPLVFLAGWIGLAFLLH
jgi:hypothetical protein